MAPSSHAKLSPSASARWLTCPASVRMEAAMPRIEGAGESSFAREGTLAHALAEIEASRSFGFIDKRQYENRMQAWAREFRAENYEDHVLEEMEGHVRGYVELLQQRVARVKGSSLRLEQKLETGIPGCWGTSDAVILSPEHIEIVDLKYGTGIAVDAENNTQLRLYGLGAVRLYEPLLGRVQHVYMTIYQPRLNNISTEQLTRAEIMRWKRDVAMPGALETQNPESEFHPSEKACRFCPAAGICRARIMASAGEDFGEDLDEEPRRPDALTAEEIGRALERLPVIRQWADALETYALSAIHTGAQRIPGWKVVMSSGRRTITDHTEAIQALIDAGYKAEDVAQFRTKPIGTLERLVGRDRLPQFLGPLLTKTPGKESLVPESDPRSSVSASDDFRDEEAPA